MRPLIHDFVAPQFSKRAAAVLSAAALALIGSVAVATAAGADPDPETVEISDAAGLAQLRTDIENGATASAGPSGIAPVTYELTADIDLSGVSNWQPMGDLSHPFQGYLDGQGHTISGLTISNSTDDYVGLFGVITGTVQNLNLNIADISVEPRVGASPAYVGGLAGLGSGRIAGVTVRGNDIHSNVGADGDAATIDAGGLLGAYDDTYGNVPTGVSQTLSGDTSSVTVMVQASTAAVNVGGLVGSVSADSSRTETMTDDSATGQAWAMSQSTRPVTSGGLFGLATFTTGLEHSYATGGATGGGYSFTGGLIGSAAGSMSGVYATGMASGNDSSDTGLVQAVGGLVGAATGEISEAYAAGEVDANGNPSTAVTTGEQGTLGGLVGDAGASLSAGAPQVQTGSLTIRAVWVSANTQVGMTAGADGELVGYLHAGASLSDAVISAGTVMMGGDPEQSRNPIGIAAGIGEEGATITRVVALSPRETAAFVGALPADPENPGNPPMPTANVSASFRLASPSTFTPGVSVIDADQLADQSTFTAAGFQFHSSAAADDAVWWMPDGAANPYIMAGNIVWVAPDSTDVTYDGDAPSAPVVDLLTVDGSEWQPSGLSVTLKYDPAFTVDGTYGVALDQVEGDGDYQLYLEPVSVVIAHEATPTPTPTPQPTVTETVTVTATPAPQPTVTQTVTEPATVTATPAPQPTVTETVTETAQPAPQPTVTQTVTTTETATATVTAQPTATPTVTHTVTVTANPANPGGGGTQPSAPTSSTPAGSGQANPNSTKSPTAQPNPSGSALGTQVLRVKGAQKALVLKAGSRRSVAVEAYTATGLAKVTYASSKKSVAAVAGSGRITAKKAGKAIVTASAGSHRWKIRVTVKPKHARTVKVRKVKASGLGKITTLQVGEVKWITGTVSPATSTDARVTFSSSDKAVAAIDKSGRLVARQPGKAVIKVKAGGKSSRHVVQVR